MHCAMESGIGSAMLVKCRIGHRNLCVPCMMLMQGTLHVSFRKSLNIQKTSL